MASPSKAPPAPEAESRLREEARLLHRSLFRRDPSERVVALYLRAHEEVPGLPDAPEGERLAVRAVVDRRLDAAGIEPWLRRTPRRHLLTRKLLLLSYLAECAGPSPEFGRGPSSRGRGWVRLALAGVRSGFSLLRGRVQALRHGIV